MFLCRSGRRASTGSREGVRRGDEQPTSGVADQCVHCLRQCRLRHRSGSGFVACWNRIIRRALSTGLALTPVRPRMGRTFGGRAAAEVLRAICPPLRCRADRHASQRHCLGPDDPTLRCARRTLAAYPSPLACPPPPALSPCTQQRITSSARRQVPRTPHTAPAPAIDGYLVLPRCSAAYDVSAAFPRAPCSRQAARQACKHPGSAAAPKRVADSRPHAEGGTSSRRMNGSEEASCPAFSFGHECRRRAISVLFRGHERAGAVARHAAR